MMVTFKRVCIKAFFILLMKMFPKKNSKDKLIGELKVPFLMSKIKVSFYPFLSKIRHFCWIGPNSFEDLISIGLNSVENSPSWLNFDRIYNVCLIFFVGNIFFEKLDILTGWVINIFLYTFSLGRDWDLSPIEIFILPRGDRILVFGWLLMFRTGVWIYSELQPPWISVHFCSHEQLIEIEHFSYQNSIGYRLFLLVEPSIFGRKLIL